MDTAADRCVFGWSSLVFGLTPKKNFTCHPVHRRIPSGIAWTNHAPIIRVDDWAWIGQDNILSCIPVDSKPNLKFFTRPGKQIDLFAQDSHQSVQRCPSLNLFPAFRRRRSETSPSTTTKQRTQRTGKTEARIVVCIIVLAVVDFHIAHCEIPHSEKKKKRKMVVPRQSRHHHINKLDRPELAYKERQNACPLALRSTLIAIAVRYVADQSLFPSRDGIVSCCVKELPGGDRLAQAIVAL